MADENLTEKMVRTERVFNGRLLKVRKDTVLLPNGKEAGREWIEHPGAVAIVPVLSDGRIVMVKQYRYPVGAVTLEIPAGKLDQGESPEDCARRELKEETGYAAGTLKKIAAIGTTMAFSNEIIHLYVAEQLEAGTQCPDEDEFIHAELFSWDVLEEMMRDGRIYDAKTVAALLMAKANFIK